MTWTRCTLAVAIALAGATHASAQFLPIIGLPTIGQGGIAFQIGGRNLSIGGFVPLGPPYPAVLPVTPTPFGYRPVGPAFLPYGYYGYSVAPGFPFPGYGAINRSVTVQVVNPTVVVQSRRPPTVDLSGIDLDVESPDKIWGTSKQALAKAPAPKKAEAAKIPEPPPPKKQQVAAAPEKPPPPAPKPKPEPITEGERFVKLGIKAFKRGDYGVAVLRFQQASDADPPGPRSYFLEAQAAIAVGKYRDAVRFIQRGLRNRPDWPLSGFRPRLELYDNNADLWHEHRGAIEKAHKLDPQNADYLFLLGYLDWFDGDRETAVAYFQQARAFAADVRWSDMFLKVAKK